MLTAFGKFCRMLRIDRGELLKDMADKLDVASSYLSAVEVGRRNVPTNWPDMLAKQYDLTNAQIKEMKTAVEQSKTQLKMELSGLSPDDRDIAMAFAREFKGLNEDKKNQILNILKKK